MTLVVDASTVAAALIDTGPHGRWAEDLLTADLAAPHILHAEVAGVLRHAVRGKAITSDVASMAHANLLELSLTLVAYELVATRVWELRDNVSPYDAWYVAAAELLGAPLATLDGRLVRAPGPRCEFATP